MSDLTKAFDFDHPDYSLPNIPNIDKPSTDSGTGQANGFITCELLHPSQRPPVPSGQQTEATSLVSEQGFKTVRGDLTEGRYLVFEMNGYALTNENDVLSSSTATAQHDTKSQRWVAHQLTLGTPQFTISSAVDGSYVTTNGTMVSGSDTAAVVTVKDLGNGVGHSLNNDNNYLAIDSNGEVSWGTEVVGFSTYSVTYNN
jgi:phospholipase C